MCQCVERRSFRVIREGVVDLLHRLLPTTDAQPVIVRGWVEERNGPRIEASRPEQIEIAELN